MGEPKAASSLYVVIDASLNDVISCRLQSASSSTYEMGVTVLSPATVTENSEPELVAQNPNEKGTSPKAQPSGQKGVLA